jgi:hypothetical protein
VWHRERVRRTYILVRCLVKTLQLNMNELINLYVYLITAFPPATIRRTHHVQGSSPTQHNAPCLPIIPSIGTNYKL